MTTPPGDLMRALNFDAADLRANRQGRISAAQMQRLRASRRRSVLIVAAAFMALVLISTALLFLGQRQGNDIALACGLGTMLINALLIGLSGRGLMRIGGDLRAGHVDAISGCLERVIRRGPMGDSCLLRLDKTELQVTRDVFKAFEHGARYCVYRSRWSHVLLAAEAAAGATSLVPGGKPASIADADAAAMVK